MTALWSDLALARATRESVASVPAGQTESAANGNRESPGRRGFQHARRAIDPSWTSFALKQLREVRR
jgi:hypothetical protein